MDKDIDICYALCSPPILTTDQVYRDNKKYRTCVNLGEKNRKREHYPFFKVDKVCFTK